MGTETNPPYAAASRQQIVELYAAGRTPGELSAEFGCSKAAIHDWVKKAGALRDLPDGGRAVKQVHRQAQRVHAAAALSQKARDDIAGRYELMARIVMNQTDAESSKVSGAFCARRTTATAARTLGVSRSGYYDWKRRAPSARAVDNKALSQAIARAKLRARTSTRPRRFNPSDATRLWLDTMRAGTASVRIALRD
jgi:Helix-turn-helix domain